jgi:hypothetical protein
MEKGKSITNIRRRKMKLGKVVFHHEYVVDLDNHNMVYDATEALIEDIESSIQNRGIEHQIKMEKAPNAKESDIPSFLTEIDTFCS